MKRFKDVDDLAQFGPRKDGWMPLNSLRDPRNKATDWEGPSKEV